MSRSGAKLDLLRETSAPGPILVHADLMRARCFVRPVTSRKAMLDDHVEVLLDACADRPLWSPCFNYDYCRTGEVDLRLAACQVGPLGEYLRERDGFWRSLDPVFSICGNGPSINEPSRKRFEAFGTESGLGQLYDRDGSLLFYGASLHSATILHFAETKSGGPVYRYDKVFKGTVVSPAGKTQPIDYVYHVRPLGMSLDYDWTRIENDLRESDLLRQQAVRGEVVARVCRVRELVDFWVKKLKSDPLYFLDPTTRQKVEAVDLAPGERFRQTEFEPVA